MSTHSSVIPSNETNVEKGFKVEDGPDTRPDSAVNKYEVTMDPDDDPQRLSSFRRWLCVVTISLASVCVTCASSAVRA